jgi:hypothetical protein
MFIIKVLLTLFVGIACTGLLVKDLKGWRSYVKSKPEFIALCIACPIYIWGAFFGWNEFFTLIAPYI